MVIKTDFGLNFRSYSDLLRYMEEEHIKSVNCSLTSDIYGVNLPFDFMTVDDIKEHIEYVKKLP